MAGEDHPSARIGHRFTPAETGALLIFRFPSGQLALVQEPADAAFLDEGPEDLVEVAVLLALGRRHGLQPDLQDPGGRQTRLATAAGIVGAEASVPDLPVSPLIARSVALGVAGARVLGGRSGSRGS